MILIMMPDLSGSIAESGDRRSVSNYYSGPVFQRLPEISLEHGDGSDQLAGNRGERFGCAFAVLLSSFEGITSR